MFDQLRDFLKKLGGEDQGGGLTDGDPRVAAAALLFHISQADGVTTPEEAARLRTLLSREYSIGDEEARRVAAAGRRADEEAVDLYHFTSVIMANTDAAQRVRFVDLLWDMTYADGDLHEMEDNLIWRIAELLGVSSRDRMLGKRDALARNETDA